MSGRKRKGGTSGGGGGGSRRNGGGDVAAAELCINPACVEIRDYYEKFRQLLQKVVDESRANKARADELQIRVEELEEELAAAQHGGNGSSNGNGSSSCRGGGLGGSRAAAAASAALPVAAPSASHTKRNGFRNVDAGQALAPQAQELSDEEAQPFMAAASEPSPPPSPPASVSSEPPPPPVRRRKSRHEFSDTGSDEGGSRAGDEDSNDGPAIAAAEVDSHGAMASEVSGGVADDAGGSAPKAKRGRGGRGAGGAEAPAGTGALGGSSAAAMLSKAPAPVLSAGSLAAWSKPANLPSFLRESPKPEQEPPPPQQQLPPEKKKRGRAAKRPAPPSPRPTLIDANGGGGGSDVQQPKQRRRRISDSHALAAEVPAASEIEDVGGGGAASKHTIATKENLIAAVRRADSASAQAIGAAVHAVSHGHADWLEAAYALWHPEVDAPPPRHALIEALLTQVTKRRSVRVRTDARRLQRNISSLDALASLTLALSTEECGQADLMEAARSCAEEALFALLASAHFSGAAPAAGAAAAQAKGPDRAPKPSKPNTSAASATSADEDASDSSVSEHDADDEAETATAENRQRSQKRSGSGAEAEESYAESEALMQWWPVANAAAHQAWLLARFLSMLYRLSGQVAAAQVLLTRLAVEMAPAPHPQLLLAVLDGWADVAERCLPGDQESGLLTAPGLFGLVLAAALASSPKRRDQDDAMTMRIRAAFAVPESLVALGPSATLTSSDGDDASSTGSADTAASLLLQRIVDSLANAQACHSSDGGAACKLCAAAAAARGGGDHSSSSSSNGGGSSKGHDRWRTAHTAIEHLAKCQRPGWLQRKYWLSGGALPSVLRGGGGGGGSGDGGGDGSSSNGSSGARCEAARALAAHALAACARAALLTEAPTYHQERITRFNKNEPKVEFGRAAAELLAAVDAVKAALETAAADTDAPAEVRAAAVAARAALLCGKPDVQGVQAALSKAGGMEGARAGRMDTAALCGIVRHAGLPCAHVINLARRPERWAMCLATGAQHGLRLHRFTALDARRADLNIPEEDVALEWDTTVNSRFDRRCEQNMMVPMTASERACAASHLALWKRLADGDLEPFKCNSTKRDMALILEDDALLSPYFVQRINMLLQHPDMAGVDLCFVGYSLPGAVRHKVKQALEQLKDDSRASQAKRGVKHGPTPMHVDFCWQAHAYLLSREGAKRLTARKPHESLIDAPVDITMATRMKSKRIAAMACHPALADQSHEYTDIVDVKSNAIQRVDTRGGAILQYM